MANLHLVTGFAGKEHITATDQGAFNAALIGAGQFVLGTGNTFEPQVISNNQIRVLDGELMMQGRFVRLEPDTYVDLAIDNGTQGMKRNDLIVARYTKDAVTGVEECNLVVIKGTPVASNPADPEYTVGDITSNVAAQNDFPLWRIPLDGINVGELVPLFTLFANTMQDFNDAGNIIKGTLHSDRLPTIPISKGGTGATTAEKARQNLSVYSKDECDQLPKINIDLLWENASPKSSFAAQSVPLGDYSKYDMLAIQTYSAEETQQSVALFAKKKMHLFSLKNNAFDGSEFLGMDETHAKYTTTQTGGTIHVTHYREIQVNQTSLWFYTCYASLGRANGTTASIDNFLRTVNDAALVPVQIYGIKGVIA